MVSVILSQVRDSLGRLVTQEEAEVAGYLSTPGGYEAAVEANKAVRHENTSVNIF